MAYHNAMNATPHHPKIKISLTIADRVFVAGQEVRGKIDLESRADKGLGINIISAELFGVQELTSRDHSATSGFLHTRRLFQGPGLPMSNAVLAHAPHEAPTLPRGYRSARKGLTSFFFTFALPFSSPSSINFGSGLARIRYDVVAQVEVFWKGEKKVVTDVKPVKVVECPQIELKEGLPTSIVGEGGKVHMQGRVIGGYVLVGQTACVELFLKNHSNRKTTGLSLSLTQRLKLSHPLPQKHPFMISDNLITVPYRGDEYCVPPGGEGVANLVFDVPPYITGVHGERRHSGEEDGHRASEALFSVECEIIISISMGIGAKDISMTIPTTIVHPQAIPIDYGQHSNPHPYVAEPAFSHPYAEQYDLEPPRPPFAIQHYSAPPSPLFTPYVPSPTQPYQSPYATPPAQASPYFGQHTSLPSTPQFSPYMALPGAQMNQLYYISSGNEYGYNNHSPLSVPVHDGPHVWLPPTSHPVVPPAIPPRSSSTGDIPQAPYFQPVPAQSNVAEATRMHAIGNEYRNEELVPQATTNSQPELKNQAVSPVSRPLPMPATVASPQALRPQPLAPEPVVDSGHVVEERAIPQSSLPPPPPPLPPQETQTLSPPSHPQRLPSLDIATALTQPMGVLSPRPRVSPRMSFSSTDADARARAEGIKVASMKSAPVEELERMAEQVLLEEEKERAEGPEVASGDGLHVDKTLPGPPVPSGKFRYGAKPPVPRASDIFSLHAFPVSPNNPQLQRSESGLDALERRLTKAAAAERWLSAAPNTSIKLSVGHKKSPSGPRNESQSHSRESSQQRRQGREGGLPPMPMPRPATPEENRWLETQLAPFQGTSGDRSRSGSRERGRSQKSNVSNGPRSPNRSPVKLEPAPESRDGEMYLLRAQAVGRVGNWLSDVDQSSAGAHHVPWGTLSGQAIPKTSSGFRSTKQLSSSNGAIDLLQLFNEDQRNEPAVPQFFTEEPPLPSNPNLSPSPALKAAATTALSPLLKSKYTSPLLSPFPPPLHGEKKYDVRSARGGRGGVVTAITSIWGNGIAEENTKPVPAGPRSKPVFKVPNLPPTTTEATGYVNAYPVRNYEPRLALKASISTPAEINGTVARPMISSAASLARPKPMVPSYDGALLASRSLPESIAGNKPVVDKVPQATGSPPVGVGQNKLRELIAKYQG